MVVKEPHKLVVQIN
uniref:Uncharacterized protein n=1 Tax=Arundo donax TaxID=35708 RepID=A0A0A9AAQ5_ARUDO